MTTRTRTRTRTDPNDTRTPKNRERAQQAADLFIEMAQYLERLARAYRDRAKYYRSGELLIAYDNLPPEAGDHMRHPVQRCIDTMSPYDVTGAYDRITAALKAIR